MFLDSVLTSAKDKSLAGTRKTISLETQFKNLPDPEPATIVTRGEWGARSPKKKEAIKHPVKLIVLKYGTSTPPCETREECEKIVKEIQRRHMDEMGMDDIGYNFLVGGDGNIYEGRGWKTKTHPYVVRDKRYIDLNSKSIDVVFIGRWIEKPPLADMMSSVADLAIVGETQGYLHTDWKVFGPSKLRKPIIKHKGMITVVSKKDENVPLEMLEDYNDSKYRPRLEALEYVKSAMMKKAQ